MTNVNKNLVFQKLQLERSYPGSACRVRHDRLRWQGTLQPTPCSRVYTVRVIHKRTKPPSVHIVDPKLVAPEGKKIPHVYAGDKLCLYHPKYREWTSSMLLADTIVPWASEWLLHYEVWLATGEWTGGGEHPPA